MCHPLEQRNFQSTRSNANSVVKASSGTVRVGWGDSDKIPVWGPVEKPINHNYCPIPAYCLLF